jgi:hypothetical protein
MILAPQNICILNSFFKRFREKDNRLFGDKLLCLRLAPNFWFKILIKPQK